MSATIRAALACAWVATTMAGAAVDPATAEPPPIVPDAIKVQPTETLWLAAPARGVQIYRCRAAKDDPTRFGWVFAAPEADLLDPDGNRIGRHYAGPTWESKDGSKVVGKLEGRADSADPGAIPWLLLVAKEHRGEGVLAKVTSITRVDTAGGLAPAAGCDPKSAGEEIRVPYTATYRFYVAEP